MRVFRFYEAMKISSHVQNLGASLSRRSIKKFAVQDRQVAGSRSGYFGAVVGRHMLAGALLHAGQPTVSPISSFAHCMPLEFLNKNKRSFAAQAKGLGLSRKEMAARTREKFRYASFATPAGCANMLGLFFRRYVLGNAMVLLAVLVGTGRRSHKLEAQLKSEIVLRRLGPQQFVQLTHDFYQYGILGQPERLLLLTAKKAAAQQRHYAYFAASTALIGFAGLMQTLRLPLSVLLLAVDGLGAAVGATVGLLVGICQASRELYRLHALPFEGIKAIGEMAPTYRDINAQMRVTEELYGQGAGQLHRYDALLRTQLHLAVKVQRRLGAPAPQKTAGGDAQAQAGVRLQIVASEAEQTGEKACTVSLLVPSLSRTSVLSMSAGLMLRHKARRDRQLVRELQAAQAQLASLIAAGSAPLPQTYVPQAAASDFDAGRVTAKLAEHDIKLSAFLLGQLCASFARGPVPYLRTYTPWAMYQGMQRVAEAAAAAPHLTGNNPELNEAMAGWLRTLEGSLTTVLRQDLFIPDEWSQFRNQYHAEGEENLRTIEQNSLLYDSQLPEWLLIRSSAMTFAGLLLPH